MIASTTKLNTPGIALADAAGVHALTDVTGFGLAGHLLEIAAAARAGVRIDWSTVPLLPRRARARAAAASSPARRAATGTATAPTSTLPDGFADVERALLTDPQTSGGLLVACAPDAVADVLGIFRADGFGQAAVIGSVTAGPPRLTIAA